MLLELGPTEALATTSQVSPPEKASETVPEAAPAPAPESVPMAELEAVPSPVPAPLPAPEPETAPKSVLEPSPTGTEAVEAVAEAAEAAEAAERAAIEAEDAALQAEEAALAAQEAAEAEEAEAEEAEAAAAEAAAEAEAAEAALRAAIEAALEAEEAALAVQEATAAKAERAPIEAALEADEASLVAQEAAKRNNEARLHAKPLGVPAPTRQQLRLAIPVRSPHPVTMQAAYTERAPTRYVPPFEANAPGAVAGAVAVSAREQRSAEASQALMNFSIKLKSSPGPKLNEASSQSITAFSSSTPRNERGEQARTSTLLPFFKERSSPYKDPMPLVLCKRGEMSAQIATRLSVDSGLLSGSPSRRAAV